MRIIQLIFILSLVACSLNSFSQNIIVQTVETSMRDASASTKSRLDENGAYCALLKVQAVNKGIQYSGNIIGEVENKTNEYWVYMKSGSDCVVISAPTYPSVTIFFKEYNIDALESKTTYNIILEFTNSTSVENLHKKELSYQDCVIKAKSDSPEAIVNLGKCFLYGIGIEENPNEAARLFEKAAEQGYVEAIYLMGNSFFYGLGNPKNYKIAVDYYTKAAEMGSVPAMYSLGLCYEQGMGVKQNKNRARKFYKRAADNGYEKAINKLK